MTDYAIQAVDQAAFENWVSSFSAVTFHGVGSGITLYQVEQGSLPLGGDWALVYVGLHAELPLCWAWLRINGDAECPPPTEGIVIYPPTDYDDARALADGYFQPQPPGRFM